MEYTITGLCIFAVILVIWAATIRHKTKLPESPKEVSYPLDDAGYTWNEISGKWEDRRPKNL